MTEQESGATTVILRWVATIAGMVIASSMLWVVSLAVSDLRSFGTGLAEMRTEIRLVNTYNKENIDRMDKRLTMIEGHLRPSR